MMEWAEANDFESFGLQVISGLSGPNEAESKLSVIRWFTRNLPNLKQGTEIWETSLAVDLVNAIVTTSVQRDLAVSRLETACVRHLGGDAGLIWYPGLVIPESEGYISGLEANQMTILECLIALCEHGPWRVLITCSKIKHTQALLYSLLNAMGGHRQRAGEVGLLSARLLKLLLESNNPDDMEYMRKAQKWLPEDRNAPDGNLCAAIVASLVNESEFKVLCEALIEDLLEGTLEPLPLLLRFSELNFHLHTYLCTHPKSLSILTKLTSELWTETHLLHCELLNCLTANRTACLLLASPCSSNGSSGINSLFDLLVAVTHRAILKGQTDEGKVLAATVRNASYFQKRLDTISSHFIISSLQLVARWPLDTPLQLETLKYLVQLIANRIEYYWTVRVM